MRRFFLRVFLLAVTVLAIFSRVEANQGYNNLGMLELSRGLIRSEDNPLTMEMRLSSLVNAEAYIKEAMRQEPRQPQFMGNLLKVYLRRGDLYAEVNDWDRAITSYQAAIDLGGTSSEAYRKIGEIYVYHKPHEPDYLDQAAKYLGKAVQLSPDFGYLRIVYGHALFFGGKIPEAIIQLKESIALGPNGYNWTVLGGFYVAEKDWEQAILCFQNALVLEPNRSDTWYGLGEASAEKGDFAEAIFAWRKTIQLAPGSEVARAAESKITELGR